MDSPRNAVHDCLSRFGARTYPAEPDVWRITLKNGSLFPVTVRIHESWLICDAPLSGFTRPLLPVLRLNGSIPPPAKFVLDRGHLQLRAEFPMLDTDHLDKRLEQVMRSLMGATHSVHNRGSGASQHANQSAKTSASKLQALRDLVSQAGWPVLENHGVSIDLRVAGASYSASIEAREHGLVGWVVLVSLGSDYTRAGCQALAHLLLSAARVLRWARPVLRGKGAEAVAGWEVWVGGEPHAAEIDDALHAISTACEMCGREAEALRDHGTAKQYLAVHGGRRES